MKNRSMGRRRLKVWCPSCGVAACARCRVLFHGALTCDEVEAINNGELGDDDDDDDDNDDDYGNGYGAAESAIELDLDGGGHGGGAFASSTPLGLGGGWGVPSEWNVAASHSRMRQHGRGRGRAKKKSRGSRGRGRHLERLNRRLIEATSKGCPSCGIRISHYHGVRRFFR